MAKLLPNLSFDKGSRLIFCGIDHWRHVLMMLRVVWRLEAGRQKWEGRREFTLRDGSNLSAEALKSPVRIRSRSRRLMKSKDEDERLRRAQLTLIKLRAP